MFFFSFDQSIAYLLIFFNWYDKVCLFFFFPIYIYIYIYISPLDSDSLYIFIFELLAGFFRYHECYYSILYWIYIYIYIYMYIYIYLYIYICVWVGGCFGSVYGSENYRVNDTENHLLDPHFTDTPYIECLLIWLLSLKIRNRNLKFVTFTIWKERSF